jgi:hypothetical protein
MAPNKRVKQRIKLISNLLNDIKFKEPVFAKLQWNHIDRQLDQQKAALKQLVDHGQNQNQNIELIQHYLSTLPDLMAPIDQVSQP